MIQGYFKDLIASPWCFLQCFLFVGGAQYHKLYFTEHHFHKIGLRAGPTTKQSSKCSRKKYNKEDKSDHCHAEDEEVLWPENFSKYNEFTLRNIEHEQRPAIDLYKRQPEEDNKIEITQPCADSIKPAFWFPCVHPFSVAFFINCCKTVAKTFFSIFFIFYCCNKKLIT